MESESSGVSGGVREQWSLWWSQRVVELVVGSQRVVRGGLRG